MSTEAIDPHLFVIFGGTGDLNQRKLLPALHGGLPNADPSLSRILGLARSDEHDDASYEAWAIDSLVESGVSREEAAKWCRGRVHFEAIREGSADDFRRVASRIEAIEGEAKLPGNRVFYLALPQGAFPSTITRLGEAELNRSAGWTRVVVEKPFGRDLNSARELNELIHRWFDESQIYRIDHYLGKETVQNLLAFRFANAIFEPIWNRDHIQSVQITVAESLGIEGRGGYYDRAGALRDMVQNHLTQILTLIAMEPPAAFEASSIRREKVKVLQSIPVIDPGQVVFGQYGRGVVEDEVLPSYLEEDGVPADSKTETFLAGRIGIQNWRWQGVPFCFRTGKAMPRKLTQIAIIFQQPPVCLFQQFGACMIHSNALIITVQPNEGFALYFDVKVPGDDSFRLETLPLRFNYEDAFKKLPDAYQTLCLDVITGDQTLFVHADEVEMSWELFTPILEREHPVYPYPAGEWGPAQAKTILHDWKVE